VGTLRFDVTLPEGHSENRHRQHRESGLEWATFPITMLAEWNSVWFDERNGSMNNLNWVSG
jgi:hypothetical protein